MLLIFKIKGNTIKHNICLFSCENHIKCSETSAHKIYLLIGTLNAYDPKGLTAETQYTIDRIVEHPLFRQRNPLSQNDIALIRVKETINISGDGVNSICLPPHDYNHTEDEFGVIAGWQPYVRRSHWPRPPDGKRFRPQLQIGWIKFRGIRYDKDDDGGEYLVTIMDWVSTK